MSKELRVFASGSDFFSATGGYDAPLLPVVMRFTTRVMQRARATFADGDRIGAKNRPSSVKIIRSASNQRALELDRSHAVS